MESTPPALFKLSADLIWNIFDELPLEVHFRFASICKHIAERSEVVLQRHQSAYSRYKVASDLDPATVPALLRSACGLGDPILAWSAFLAHVHSMSNS
jgi:hypothetical protein